ncbi:hypothetical protein ACFQS6_06580 [Xanthomonas populi]
MYALFGFLACPGWNLDPKRLLVLLRKRRSQDSRATRDVNVASSSSIASLGFLQPRVFRGRVIISQAM